MSYPSRTYHHLGQHRLRAHWHSVRIETRAEGKHVIFTSTIHVREEVEVTWCYSLDWSDEQILNDTNLAAKFSQHYGKDAFHCACCGH